MMHDRYATVKPTRTVFAESLCFYYMFLLSSGARAQPVNFGHFSTSPSRRPMVSMNSSTMSSTTERVGRTRSSEPTTWPTK
jgi:hypothetical protein